MTFTFYWLTGEKEFAKGSTPANAFSNAGYAGGAISALDFYVDGKDDEYTWNKTTKTWNRK